MTKNYKPKTTGLEWALLSIMSFNGSGYADMEDAESFINSYYAYNEMKKRPMHIMAIKQFYNEVYPAIDMLLETTNGPGNHPTEKNLKKFAKFYPKAENWIIKPLNLRLNLL